MNVCRFNKNDLVEMDIVIKRELRRKLMHGKQPSDERLYPSRRASGKGVKSLRDVYKQTKVRVIRYMVVSDSPWMRVAWAREVSNEYCTIRREAEEVMKNKLARVLFFKKMELS